MLDTEKPQIASNDARSVGKWNDLFSWDPPTHYFDQIADVYSLVDRQDTAGGRARRVRRARVMELFDKAGGRVLDVGCGPGVLAPAMLSRGCDFWGLDGSRRMIAQCNKAFPGCERAHFLVGEATALPFTDGFFDAVTCLGVIDRIENYPLALKEMARVLKEDGTLMVAVGNLLSPGALWRNFIYSPLVALLRPFYYGMLNKPRKPAMSPVARLQLASTYKKLVTMCGCETTDVVYLNFNMLPSPLDELFPKLATSFADKAEEMRLGRLRWLGQAFLLKAKKLREPAQSVSLGNRCNQKKIV